MHVRYGKDKKERQGAVLWLLSDTEPSLSLRIIEDQRKQDEYVSDGFGGAHAFTCRRKAQNAGCQRIDDGEYRCGFCRNIHNRKNRQKRILVERQHCHGKPFDHGLPSGEFNLERNTGDIEFHGCDAETIYVETDTGDVTGTLLTDKVFITETDTGSVDVPKSVSGGRCEISTDTGDIRIEIQ